MCAACAAGTTYVYVEDKKWNANIKYHVEQIITAAKHLLGKEDDEVFAKALIRDMTRLFGAVLVYMIVAILSIGHFIVCLLIDNLHYQQTFVGYILLTFLKH